MFRKQKFIQNAPIKSESYSPKMFDQKRDNDHNGQNIDINITMNENKDDGMAECLSGCFSMCVGLGKKAATS